MSSRLFQNIIYQMGDIIDRTIGVIDDAGTIVASNENIYNDISPEQVFDIFDNEQKVAVHNGITYQAIWNRNKIDYVVFTVGDDDDAQKYCSMLLISISNIKQYYDEKYDKGNFIKNVILDNILPGDVTLKAKELHLQADASRAVFLIRTYDNGDLYVYDTVQSMFPSQNKDFIINLDERNIVLAKEVKSTIESYELEKIAKSIVDTINTEALVKVFVGIGTVVENIKDLAKSYKEAQVALEVGKVFDTEKYIINYDNLGIGRLIYQLPTTLCELFLSEVFKKESIEALDDETILTIQKFFENNLNVSETSRQLYVHRNTLVYRLDKIQKLTGLDLRTFDHAIIFKVAMMVKKYLVSNPIKI